MQTYQPRLENRMALYLSFFPLDGKIEDELANGHVIRPCTKLQFREEDKYVTSQLHQVEGFPPPTIPLTPFPKGTTLRVLTAAGVNMKIAKDAYWLEPLCFAYAHQLRKLKFSAPGKEPPVSAHYEAIEAYLDALPNDTRIFVYWED